MSKALGFLTISFLFNYTMSTNREGDAAFEDLGAQKLQTGPQ